MGDVSFAVKWARLAKRWQNGNRKTRHGFALGRKHGAVSSWSVRCAEWMRGMGLLDKDHKRR